MGSGVSENGKLADDAGLENNNGARVREILEKLSLEEKIALCSGSDFWHAEGIEKVGLPAMMM